MLRVINQFLLLQKGVFTSRYLLCFLSLFLYYFILFAAQELPKPISHKITILHDEAEVALQPEIEQSNQSCLKLICTFTIPLLWGYTYPENVSLPKSSCSGRFVDFWPLPFRMEMALTGPGKHQLPARLGSPGILIHRQCAFCPNSLLRAGSSLERGVPELVFL